jgi:hypothetical protein
MSFIQFLDDDEIIGEIEGYWSDFCAPSFPGSGVLTRAGCKLFNVHNLLKGNYLVLIQEHWKESIQLLGKVFGDLNAAAKKHLLQAVNHRVNAAPKLDDTEAVCFLVTQFPSWL